MIATAFADNVTALGTLLLAASAFVAAVLNRVKLREIHKNTTETNTSSNEINKAVNGKQSGAVSIQQQVQELYDHRPPEARNADAGLVLAVHAVLAKLEAIEKRLDK